MSKVIFLDFDGPLNPEDNMRAMINLQRVSQGGFPSRDKYGILFDERCVRWLRWILFETGAQIVVSSTWRILGQDKLKEMWDYRVLPGGGELIIDFTPDLARKEGTIWVDSGREAEIESWLDKHRDLIEKWCIIDVLPIKGWLRGGWVEIDPVIGLNEMTAKEAVRILNGENK